MTATRQGLVFSNPGCNPVVVPHIKKADKHTSGAMCIPGAHLVTATSGFGSTLSLSLPKHQLHNDNGEPVKRMCAELGYRLASYRWQGGLDNGQYLAVHVEKRLLGIHYNEYIRRKGSTACRTPQSSSFRGGWCTIYVDRKPCFDCILFANYYMIKTDTLVQIYLGGIERVEPSRQDIQPMAIRLKAWSGLLNDEDIHDFIRLQEHYISGRVSHKKEGKRLFASSAAKVSEETYTRWIEEFNQSYEHRLKEYQLCGGL